MSLGQDLASIRKEQGLTLEDIQSSIKIPLYTLESIEDNSIFDHPEHNKTYIRSFIRSYARALKIDDAEIVNAIDAYEAGIYDNDLLDPPPTGKVEVNGKNKLKSEKKPEAPVEEKETEFDLSQVNPPEIEQIADREAPDVKTVNWADMGKRFSLQDSSSKAKVVVGSIIFLVIILFSAGIYYWEEVGGLFNISDPEIVENIQSNNPPPILDDDSQPATDPAENSADNSIDSAPPENTAEQQTPENIIPNTGASFETASLAELDDTLSVVVYAAFDKLEPVRVTSDFNWRTNPFWMEQGQAFKFDFRDTVLVRGQYSRMMLIFNGHVVENPANEFYSDDFDSIMLTRNALVGSRYLQAAPEGFPYEVGLPDSIVYPIRY